MKTVTVTFNVSRNHSETATFDVYNQKELTKKEFFLVVNDGADYVDDWDNEALEVELTAARMAGISEGEPFTILRK
jgi:hypothetical protein